jgi:3-oxoadipate enol-lactonase
MTAVAEPMLESRDLLSFDAVGQGAPVLLVHAFPLDREMWRPQIERWSPHRRVVSVDLRGFGESPRTDGSRVSMRRHADDLVQVLDHLEIAQVSLVGLSLGGYVGLAFAEFYPDRLRTLVLAHTRATADSFETKAARERQIQQILAEGIEALASSLPAKMLGSRAPAAARNLVRDLVARQDPNGAISALRGMEQREDRTAIAAGLTLPVLVIGGAEDELVPPIEALGLHATIPGSEWIEFPGAGHLSNLERPDSFSAAVARFLDVHEQVQ